MSLPSVPKYIRHLSTLPISKPDFYSETQDPTDFSRNEIVEITPETYPTWAHRILEKERTLYDSVDHYGMAPILPSNTHFPDFPFDLNLYIGGNDERKLCYLISPMHFTLLYNHSDLCKISIFEQWLLRRDPVELLLSHNFLETTDELELFCGVRPLICNILKNEHSFRLHNFIDCCHYLMINDNFMYQVLSELTRVEFAQDDITTCIWLLLNTNQSLPKSLNWFALKFPRWNTEEVKILHGKFNSDLNTFKRLMVDYFHLNRVSACLEKERDRINQTKQFVNGDNGSLVLEDTIGSCYIIDSSESNTSEDSVHRDEFVLQHHKCVLHKCVRPAPFSDITTKVNFPITGINIFRVSHQSVCVYFYYSCLSSAARKTFQRAHKRHNLIVNAAMECLSQIFGPYMSKEQICDSVLPRLTLPQLRKIVSGKYTFPNITPSILTNYNFKEYFPDLIGYELVKYPNTYSIKIDGLE